MNNKRKMKKKIAGPKTSLLFFCIFSFIAIICLIMFVF
jgi:hypothetical protein